MKSTQKILKEKFPIQRYLSGYICNMLIYYYLLVGYDGQSILFYLCVGRYAVIPIWYYRIDV